MYTLYIWPVSSAEDMEDAETTAEGQKRVRERKRKGKREKREKEGKEEVKVEQKEKKDCVKSVGNCGSILKKRLKVTNDKFTSQPARKSVHFQLNGEACSEVEGSLGEWREVEGGRGEWSEVEGGLGGWSEVEGGLGEWSGVEGGLGEWSGVECESVHLEEKGDSGEEREQIEECCLAGNQDRQDEEGGGASARYLPPPARSAGRAGGEKLQRAVQGLINRWVGLQVSLHNLTCYS